MPQQVEAAEPPGPAPTPVPLPEIQLPILQNPHVGHVAVRNALTSINNLHAPTKTTLLQVHTLKRAFELGELSDGAENEPKRAQNHHAIIKLTKEVEQRVFPGEEQPLWSLRQEARILAKIEQSKEALEKKIGESETKLEKKIGESQTKLEKKIGESETKLEKKIEQSKEALEKKIGESETKLEKKIGESETKLEKKIGESETKLEKKIGESETKLEKKIGESEKKLEKKNGESQKKLETKLDKVTSDLKQLRTDLQEAQTRREWDRERDAAQRLNRRRLEKHQLDPKIKIASFRNNEGLMVPDGLTKLKDRKALWDLTEERTDLWIKHYDLEELEGETWSVKKDQLWAFMRGE